MTNSSRVTILILFLASIFPIVSHAECAIDHFGTVYCSGLPSGGAVADNFGAVQCGKGNASKTTSALSTAQKSLMAELK